MNRVVVFTAFAFAVLAFAAPLAAFLSTGSTLALVALALVVALVATVLARRRRTEDDAGGSVWELVPAWQYDGRHVESGGHTRGEQERALREIQEQARKRAADDPDSE